MQIKILIMALVFMFLPSMQALADDDSEERDQPSIFSHQDIQIDPQQYIERLLVSSANAVVAGEIAEEVIIVDGDLTVLPSAKIRGKIIILGGQLKNESGNAMEKTPWIIAPAKFSFTAVVLIGVILFSVVGLIVVPYLLWMLIRILSRFPFFIDLKERLLKIRDQWPFLYIAITLIFSALMLILFMAVAWQTIFRQSTGVFDSVFIWCIRYFASSELDRIMIRITNLGFSFFYGSIVFITVSVLTFLRRWIELKGLVICLLGGTVLNEILKHMFERTRPEVFHIVAASGFSFPSGHAMTSLCFYGMLTFFLVRNRSRHWILVGTVAAVILIASIGISRIYLGVHYPSDIVAGYAAGATWLSFSISLVMWWEKKREQLLLKQ